jgi:hypothetical protein
MQKKYQFVSITEQLAGIGFEVDAITGTNRFQSFHGNVYE